MAGRPRFERDYYGTLGVGPEATDDDIRKAYRRLALTWHPDRNRGDAGAAERFKEISEAYAVLIDSRTRREYDAARRVGAAEPFSRSRDDIFRDLFRDPRASAVFDDLAREFARMGLRVERRDFHQTLFGGRGVVVGGVFVVRPMVSLWELARAALRGATPSPQLSPPPERLGGRVRRAGRWLLGLAASNESLLGPDLQMPLRLTRREARDGTRKLVTLDAGRRQRELVVTVPAGTRSGTKLRLRGKGRTAPGRPAGDLYLAVEVVE